MNSMPIPAWFDESCQQIGLELSPDERDGLARFLEMLLETNQRFNLTAIKEPDAAWRRHIFESIALLPMLEGVARVIDVGSGGGLPGLPLAIIMPDVQFALLEATGKKARFLQESVTALGLSNVTILNDRAENLGQSSAHRQAYDVATARAVGPMNVLAELTMPFVRIDGRVLAVKGARFAEELDEAADAFMKLGGAAIEIYEHLPGMEDDSVVIELTKLEQTPKIYPRSPGTPKHDPL